MNEFNQRGKITKVSYVNEKEPILCVVCMCIPTYIPFNEIAETSIKICP